MTQTKLNLDLLVEMIDWAGESVKAYGMADDLPERYAGWGTWYQGQWSTIKADELPIDLLHATSAILNASSFGDDDELDGLKSWREVIEKAKNACGTAQCIAGETVIQAGYRMVYTRQLIATTCVARVPTDEVDSKGNTIWKDVPGAKPQPIDETAQELLGLTDGQASSLFHGTNTLSNLRVLANRFAREAGLPEPYANARAV